VVAQQELFIQKLTAENQQLKTQLDAAEARKKQYKATLAKHKLI
jgi:hypothetical protein